MSLNEILDTLTRRAGFNTNAVILGTTLLGMAAGAFLISTSLGYTARSTPVLISGADLTGIAEVVCIHLTLAHSGLKEDAAIGIVLWVFFGVGIVLLLVLQRSAWDIAAGINHSISRQTKGMTHSDAMPKRIYRHNHINHRTHHAQGAHDGAL